ncbi:MAG TPA: phosphate propanoyltransferase [Phycisphaerae bacterium]|nr:phosphate propanoyltransferase [Phycisphaerae bacterium]
MTTALNIPMPREQLERVVRQLVRERFAEALAAGETQLSAAYAPNLVVNVSARHLHISKEHLQQLFGPGAELTVYRWLYQPGEFAAEQTVTIIGPRRRVIDRVRILGPTRPVTQVELSLTDAIALGVDAPVRPSGKMEGTPGCVVLGPKGVVELSEGVIRAERHVHMSPADAKTYGFRDRQYVGLRVVGDCATVFEQVLCRVDPKFLLEVHLDTDEGNACNLVNATSVELMA